MDNQIKVLLTAVDNLSGPLGTAAGKLEQFGAKAKSIGQNLEQIGTRIGGLGLATQAGLSQAGLDMSTLVKGAVDTEKALYGIANTAGFSGAQAKAMVGEWSIAMNQIAASTNQAQSNVTQAFNDLIAKGMDPKVAIQQLTAIGRAATASAADIGDMASAANASLANMGVEAKQSLEIMAQAGKSGAFELRDMAQYFDLLTVKSSLLGQKGAEGMASLAAAAQIARKGAGDASTAANNLANFLDKLSAPVTANAFKKFGLNLGEEVKKGLASGDLIGYMAETIQKATGGDAAKISQLFADVQAKNFIAPMVQNLEEYKRIRDEALSASGVVDQDFATAMQSTAAALDQMKVSASAAVNNSGALQDMVGALKSLSGWVAENPDLAKWVIFGSAGAVVGGAVVAGIGATVTAIGGMATALSGLATFLIANPVVLAVLGIGAAAGIAYKLSDDLNLGGHLYDLVQTIKSVPDQLSSFAADWMAAGANLIQSFKDGIAERLKGALGIGQKITEAIAWLNTQAKEWIKIGHAIVDGIIQGIKDKASAMWAEVKALGAGALKSIKDSLGIRSPSREFMIVGDMAGEGLRLGILAKVDDVRKAAAELGGAALYATKDKLTAEYLKSTIADEQALIKALAEDNARIAEEGARLTQRLRTELEIAMDTMADYDRLLQAGAITWDTYARAVAETTEGIKTAGDAVDEVAAKVKKSYRDNKGRFLPADEAERAAAEWGRAAEDINRSLTDALMRGFEGGRNFMDSFVSTLKSTFSTLVLRPIIAPIVASVTGALGLGGSSPALASGGGIGGNISVLSSLKSAYEGITTGFASLGNTVAGYASYAQTALGSTYGTSALSQQSMMLAGQNAGFSTSAFASQLGTAASYLGAAATGMFIGNMISGGYSAIGKNSMVATGVGTAAGGLIGAQIGSIGGPLGMVIGGTIGGLVNRAFGMGPKQTTGEGISGTFGSGDFSGSEWTTWRQKGGWFRSDKSGTITNPLVGAADLTLSQTFAALQDGVADFATALGRPTDQVMAYTRSISLNLRGLDEAARQAKFDEIFAEMGNAMAQLALGTTRYTRSGETASQTLERLAGHLTAVNAVLDSLGRNAYATSLAGADMANMLADLAGGIEAFTNLSAGYYQNFYSDAERFEAAVDGMRETLINIGVSTIPQTKAAFRDLMEAQDLTTVSGRATYAALLNVSAGFSDLINNIEGQIANLEAEQLRIAQAVIGERDGLENRLNTLLGNTAALRAAELAKVDPLNRELFLHVQALQDAADAQAAYNEQLNALADAGSGIAAFVRELRAGLNGGTAAQSLSAARRAYADDLARARLGDVNASSAITGSAAAYLEALKTTARNRTEYDIAATRMAAELEALPATKSHAQQQAESLAALVAQGDSLQVLMADLNTALADAVDSGFSGLDLNLDGLLTFEELKAGLDGLATDKQIVDLIKSVDINGDGQISATEAVQAATQNVDDNTYGLLDAGETQISAMRKLVAETITNSGNLQTINVTMASLRDALTEMTEQERIKAAIANKNLEIEALLKQQDGAVASVNAGIATIWSLASKHGVWLNAHTGATLKQNTAVFEVTDQGLFNAKYGQITHNGNAAAAANFKTEYYAKGGAYDQTYGMASTLSDLAKKIEAARQSIRDLGGIPAFAVGTNYVPHDMLAQIHEGERIIPAADNAALMDALQSPARRDAVLVAEIKALREELAALRAETRATASHTAKTARLLDRVMPDGDALSVRTAA